MRRWRILHRFADSFAKGPPQQSSITTVWKVWRPWLPRRAWRSHELWRLRRGCSSVLEPLRSSPWCFAMKCSLEKWCAPSDMKVHTHVYKHTGYIYFFRRHIFVFVFIHWCAKLVQKRLKTKPSSTTHTSLNQTGACWWETVWIAHRMTTNDVSKHDGMPAQDVQPHLKWPL